MYASDYAMTCNAEISFVANTLNKIHISTTIYNEFNSTYVEDKDNGFGILFKQYTVSCDNNVYQLYLIKEQKKIQTGKLMSIISKREFTNLP